jgi:2-C-methyl-D-erythritol 2,4-cyclodiphosphate synthase
MNFRIGFGYDVHRLAADRKFVIGGVEIPHSKGLLGHSDADVLIHAICDALLGATGLRDIGHHFPDHDPSFKDADSKVFLGHVVRLISEKGWEIGNIDCTIALQNPKISPYIEKMRDVLSALMQTDKDNVSVKATTTEGLGFVGHEEGAAAYAVVLVFQQSAGE